MFGIPLEVISMAGATVLGAVLKLWGQAQADKAEQHKMLLENRESIDNSKDRAAARANNPAGAWIRRFIVVTLMSFVGFILLAPMLGQPTNVATEVTTGWLWWEETKTVWTQLNGVVTPEWLKYAMLDIISLYFGTSAVARR